MAEEATGFKATRQQITVGVITAVLIAILSFGSSSLLSMNNRIQENHEAIEMIRVTLPAAPELQVIINERISGKLGSITEALDSFTIDSGFTKMEQEIMIRDIEDEVEDIKRSLGL